MRRKPEVLVLALIAVLFTSTAAQADAPTAKSVPDIRHAVDGSGVPAASILDLDEYVIDPSDRDANGVQDSSTLLWSENSTLGDDNVDVTANELEVAVPAVGTPEEGDTTLRVVDTEANEVFTAVKVKTVDALLSGPLVDDYLVAGGSGNSSVPFSWCISGTNTLRIQPVSQTGIGGGRLFVSASVGGANTCFYAADTVVDASEQITPLAPYEAAATAKGIHWGSLGLATINTVNLSADASLSGLFVTADGSFSDWVRITVARTYDSGARDSYSVAIGDALEGTTLDLIGDPGVSVPTKIDADSNYGFEDLTINELLGAASEFAYESDPGTARLAQSTAWDVTVMGQAVNTIPAGGSLPGIDLTVDGKPAATYPGATDGRALKLTFDAADAQGIFFSHKGIPDSSYDPGDVITFSMNLYVDLDYAGGVADDINEPENGMVIAMALTAQPLGNAGAFNYLLFPPTEADLALQDFPGGGATDLGQHARVNILAALHGAWTRHEVSYRVPEFGQNVTTALASGDYIDSGGISAKFVIGRTDTTLTSHTQTVWLDNISIAKCPGALCLAQGAVNCPMVSAGWAPEWAGVGQAGSSLNGGNTGAALPAALAREAVINGNFSTGAATAAIAPIPNAAPISRMVANADSGWFDSDGQQATGSLVYIGEGAGNVALGFPTGFNQALAISPDPTTVGIGLTPVQDTAISGTTAAAAGFQGGGNVITPLLDMRVPGTDLTPGLRVNDIAFPGGTGGRFTPNGITGNVSGVFGIRFFARSNGTSPADNPSLNVILENGDLSNGIVGQYSPQTLPNGADALGSGIVWSDNQFSGTVVSFSSAGRTDLLANNEAGPADPALAATVAGDNPGSQLALVNIQTTPPNNQASTALIQEFLNGFPALGAYTGQGLNPTGDSLDALPGRWGTATVHVDEVGLYAVRDINAFYDEDLSFVGLP